MALHPESSPLWTPTSKSLWTPEGSIEKSSKEADPRSKRAYMFISGGLGANSGLVGIEQALREVTGSPFVKVTNSVISMDEHDPKRHEHQAVFIKEQLDSGREVEIITHSLGSLECTRAINLILDEDPHFFDDPDVARRFTINYTGSSGFDRGLIHETNFLVRYVALAGPLNRGINGVTAFPPRNLSSEELTDGMRFLFGSEKPKDMLSFSDRDNNYDKLPPEKQELLIVQDYELKEHLANRKRRKVKDSLLKRGQILNDHIFEVLDGKYIDGNPFPIAPEVDYFKLVRKPEVREAFLEMLTKSIYTTTQVLLEKGVNLKVVGLEHDRAITRSSMQYFVDNTATHNNKGEISYVELMGHMGPALQANYYIDAVTRRKGEEYPVL